MRFGSRLFRAGLCLVLAVCAPASGATVAAGWMHEHWTAADGLPVNAVNAVAQDPDGYLWLATFDGLVRFDGVRFTSFNTVGHPGLPSNRFVAVTVIADGALLLRSEQDHFIHYSAGRFTTLGTEDGLPGDDLLTVYPAADGSLLLGTRKGAARYRDGEVERIDAGRQEDPVRSFLEGPDGVLWVGTENGLVRLASDGAVDRILPADGLPSADVRSLALIDGTLWIGTTAGVAVWRDGAAHPVPGTEALTQLVPGTEAQQGLLDEIRIVEAAGTVWMATHAGVFGYRDGRLVDRSGGDEPVSVPGRPAWTDEDGALWINTGRRLLRDGRTVFRSDAAISQVMTDREGNIWLACTDGLHRLRGSPFEVYREAHGLRSENLYPIFQAGDGTVWLGTLGAGLARIRDGEVEMVGPEAGTPTAVWALEQSADGALWVGGTGLCLLRDDVCRREGIPGPLVLNTVRAIHRDRSGTVWFGSTVGLFAYRDGRWQRFSTADGVPRQPIRVFAEGVDGSLWMGTNGGGIVRHAAGRFETMGKADGLCSNLVRALHFDAQGDLWVGTEDRGLCHLALPNGDLSAVEVTRVGRGHGLPDYTVHRILDDRLGRYWMSGNRGIWWVPYDQLKRLVAGERRSVDATVYTERDGLPTREANGGVHPAGIRADDGRLWFPTQRGAVVIDPRHLPHVPAPPAAILEQVVVGNGDDRRVLSAPELPAALILRPRERQIELEYTAPSFTDPAKIRFRYRLDGFDDSWVEAADRRLASYTNLRPGEYRFRVAAAGAHGAWNETGNTLDFTVRARWYETKAAFAAAALLLVAAGLGAGRWRIHEIDRRRRQLEVEVAARTEELAGAQRDTETALATVAEQAAALEELDHAKSRFFANISHELRTPLTVIRGGLEETLEGRFGELPEELERQHGALLRNTRSLQALIEQLLDLNRLEAGRLELAPEPGDLVAFLERRVEAFAPLAERLGIALALETEMASCPRAFDAEKLEKIVANLLSNALKFTPRGGSVRVRLSGDATAVAIAVADDGPGIPADARERIFERFTQLDDGVARSGAGIGLALARELAELHGGTIAVDSRPGAGSLFTVRLPLAEATLEDVAAPAPPATTVGGGDPPPPATASPEPEDADRTTLLVVEDNEDVRAYVRRSLADTYRVVEAADGETGLARARDVLPDLVVTDLMLPGIDGYALVRALKADAATECIPVVMLTARAAVDDEVAGYDSGAEGYVTKPFAPEALRAAVARLLEERRRLRRRLREEPWERAQEGAAEGAGAEPEDDGRASLAARARAAVLRRLYEDELDIDELASALNMSRSSLYRRLHEEAGVSPGTLIQTVRLERARELLADRRGAVTEVAYAVGFKSLSHFTRSFSDRYGRLPSSPAESRP